MKAFIYYKRGLQIVCEEIACDETDVGLKFNYANHPDFLMFDSATNGRSYVIKTCDVIRIEYWPDGTYESEIEQSPEVSEAGE